MQHDSMVTAIVGFVSSIFTLIITHPLDVIKTRMQVSDSQSGTAKYSSMCVAVTLIWAQERLRGYYAGLGSSLICTGLSWNLYVFLYKNAMDRWEESGMWLNGTRTNLLCAIEAGMIALVITNPLWVLKTRMEIQHRSTYVCMKYNMSTCELIIGQPLHQAL